MGGPVRPSCHPPFVDTEELVVVLLTGGGLALIGTVLGALITQVFAVRIGREARREERRMAVKTFQRDTLVALQDAAVELAELAFSFEDGVESDALRLKFDTSASHLQMLGSRVRDEHLRKAVDTHVNGLSELVKRDDQVRNPNALIDAMLAQEDLQDRAGQLIRTLDAIDEDYSK